jgi:NADH dehydrogenase/NADH:ubiquinone oxidoreductase subunit G
MIELIIDSKKVNTGDNTTILDAARSAGIDIPTLCHYDKIPPCVSCFVCVVKVEGYKNFLPACATKARNGMIVDASSQDVRDCRKRALELMFSEHTGTFKKSEANDALIQCGCLKKNTCRLKSYAEEYAADITRYTANSNRKNAPRKKYDSGLIHEPGKCIVCGKCVAITKARNIIPGLSLTGRGSEVHVSAPFETPFDEAMGDALAECAAECPTGALWMLAEIKKGAQ